MIAPPVFSDARRHELLILPGSVRVEAREKHYHGRAKPVIGAIKRAAQGFNARAGIPL
jgi:hypothetical protein